ncbi:Na+/H+ antiporter subunit A [Listeria ilorinensis]|uniref:Na+/H+ antiporter subunit A n=1 Tax=Listeria ilorinensis TaxID=2867439 RepID=UPI001EF66323|nr:Na+/H+ antiporter subunit A [Listeria ilorinensis]
MSLLHVAILLPFFAALFIPLVYKWTKKIHTGWLVLPIPVLLFIYFCSFIPKTMHQSTTATMPWIPSFGINFTVVVDGLSLLFALLITGIGSLVVFYSIYYLGKKTERLNNFYAFLMIFMSAMLGVVLSDNLIVLYLFWEMTSISSFLLIGYWYHRERSRYGARKSMMITVFGGLMMLGGFILLHIMTDSFSVREIIASGPAITGNPLFVPAMIFILLGAFTKSAQVPFHVWLPDAMEAPTPVSAYLHSATMVKAGIYIVARFTPLFAVSEVWFWTIAIVGIITLLWGSINATKKNDLKAILAYSTISQLGLIMSLLGVGALSLHFGNEDFYAAAIVAAVFHLFNHATFKGSLFMMVGIVDHETGTRDIRRLGGLMRIMPITATIAFIGTFAMAGLPPFNGFLSKEMFFESMTDIVHMNLWNADTWGVLLPVIAWIASVFTFVYSMIIFFKTFTGKNKPYLLPKKPHEAPLGLLLPPSILAFLVVIIGIFPNLIAGPILEPAVKAIVPTLATTDSDFSIHVGFWHGITPALLMTIGVVIVGILLYKTNRYWKPWITTRVPKKWRIGRAYDASMFYLEQGSYRTTMWVMTGWLRTYLNYMLTAFIILIIGTMFVTDAFNFNLSAMTPVTAVDFVLAAVILVTLIGTVFSKSRITSIILLGAMGYTVSIFFIISRAPDLALTQLVIETISVVLYLLVFYHLPQFSNIEEKPKWFSIKTILSIGVGITVTLIALSAFDTTFYDSISQYYLDNAYKEAAGKNVVNVILVDFRGFDTLFETAVLAIASIGIYAMIKLRLTKRREKDENQ